MIRRGHKKTSDVLVQDEQGGCIHFLIFHLLCTFELSNFLFLSYTYTNIFLKCYGTCLYPYKKASWGLFYECVLPTTKKNKMTMPCLASSPMSQSSDNI